MTWLVFGIASCAPGDSERLDAPSTFTRIDSAGILLSITQEAQAGATLGWGIDPVPNLVIGGEDSLFLDRVQGLRALPDGGVLIVDAGSRELRFHDSGGRFSYRTGGNGEGPGEFRDPVLIPWPGSDSILVADRRLPRLQVFSLDGRSHRAIPYAQGWPQGRVPPMGAVDPTTLLFRKSPPITANVFAQPGLHRFVGEYVLHDPVTGGAIHLDSLEYGWSLRISAALPTRIGVPFRSPPVAAVIENGAVIADGSAWEVRAYDREGRLQRIFRVVDRSRRPVTSEMIDSALASMGPISSAERNELSIPDSLPTFASLVVDSEGWLWAGLYRLIQCGTFPHNRVYSCSEDHYQVDQTEARAWMVFDPDGQARGMVRTPPGLEIQSIGEDHILGVWRDELGVEHVRRHALRRSGTPPL